MYQQLHCSRQLVSWMPRDVVIKQIGRARRDVPALQARGVGWHTLDPATMNKDLMVVKLSLGLQVDLADFASWTTLDWWFGWLGENPKSVRGRQRWSPCRGNGMK